MSVSSFNCVHGCSPLTSFNSHPKPHHKLTANDKLLWLSTTKTTTATTPLVLQSSHQRTASVRTDAVFSPESLLVAATSTAKPPDIKVFLVTSAGLFFLYWVTNFVVPDMVTKNLNEDEKKK